MKDKFRTLIRNPYFIITAVYLLTHFFMLILSGCWWDDWTFMSHHLDYVNAVASQSGRPEWNILIPFCWSLPNNGRILIFFMYLIDSYCVYHILKGSDLFDEKSSLIITLLFTVIPVNDARILISNFSYTVGLFFFYLAFALFVNWNRMEKGTKKRLFRIPILGLFFISFILNSVLAYYYILIAYLFVLEMKNRTEPNIIKRAFSSVISVLKNYPDFFVIPFVYYALNKIFFPTYGDVFGSYNAVTVKGLINAVLHIPLSMVKAALDIIYQWKDRISIPVLVIMAVAVLVIVMRKDSGEDRNFELKDTVLYFVYGLFILFMGLLPYVMVRGGTLTITGVKGRDAVLVPFGAAVILYSLCTLLKGKLRKAAVALILILSIASFNSLYLEWQKDYYYQLSLENLLDNEVIRDNNTFFLIDLNETDIEAQRYYSLNANAANVYHDESRLFIPKVSNLSIIKDEKELTKVKEELNNSHVMADYEIDDLYFDAVLDYYCDYSDPEVIKMKYYEIFDPEEFDRIISSSGTLKITAVDDDFTVKLLEEYDKGNLHSDEDVLQLLLSYAQ